MSSKGSGYPRETERHHQITQEPGVQEKIDHVDQELSD
jgi:hypothetical protein